MYSFHEYLVDQLVLKKLRVQIQFDHHFEQTTNLIKYKELLTGVFRSRKKTKFPKIEGGALIIKKYICSQNEPLSCFWITWTRVFRFKDISVFSTAWKSSKHRYVGSFDGPLMFIEFFATDFWRLVKNSVEFCTSVDNGWKKSNTGRDRDIRSGKEINV